MLYSFIVVTLFSSREYLVSLYNLIFFLLRNPFTCFVKLVRGYACTLKGNVLVVAEPSVKKKSYVKVTPDPLKDSGCGLD